MELVVVVVVVVRKTKMSPNLNPKPFAGLRGACNGMQSAAMPCNLGKPPEAYRRHGPLGRPMS